MVSSIKSHEEEIQVMEGVMHCIALHYSTRACFDEFMIDRGWDLLCFSFELFVFMMLFVVFVYMCFL